MPMTPRERMLAAIRHQKVDRIPTDIWATAEVHQKLREHFGQDANINERLRIDGMSGVSPEYVGPALPTVPEDEQVNFWGMRSRRVQYATGIYWEQFFHPVAFAQTVRDLDDYAWPRADWFDYSKLKEQAKVARERQLLMSGYMAPFYFHNLLRGLEQSLVDPHVDPELTHAVVGKISDFFYEHHRRVFESAGGLVDIAQVTDDYGSQSGPLISLQTFRTFYRPHFQRFIALCKEFGVLVFHHDDGAMRDFIPDMIEMGVDVLNPVQWVCPGMDREGLKRDFGKSLCFHGGIDNQRILPFGTPEEVRAEVRSAIDSLASDGTGYILAPCHNIQAVTPVENIIAMYDEAWNYGRM
jgi:uroporphyrinogen decarboxylase